jgi:hypothetical protein
MDKEERAAVLKRVGLLEDAVDNIRIGLVQEAEQEAGMAANEALELAVEIARAIPE